MEVNSRGNGYLNGSMAKFSEVKGGTFRKIKCNLERKRRSHFFSKASSSALNPSKNTDQPSDLTKSGTNSEATRVWTVSQIPFCARIDYPGRGSTQKSHKNWIDPIYDLERTPGRRENVGVRGPSLFSKTKLRT